MSEVTKPCEVEVVSEDDLVPHDDAIIGKAFRWSLLAFLVIGAAIGGVVWMLREAPTQAVVKPIVVKPPENFEQPAATLPIVHFTDITKEANIDFVHFNGAKGEKLLPETMGGGCAFLDYDNDGDEDILFVNGTTWPDAPNHPLASSLPTHALYRNDGNDHFTHLTDGSGLDVGFYGMGCAVGDYDNDGWVDGLITAVGQNHLFHNTDGKFEDVTPRAGVSGDEKQWTTGCALFDYNNDGLLDLWVCHYVNWSKKIDFEVNYQLVGVGRAYGPPTNFEGTDSTLYKNNGDGTFTDVSAAANILVKNAATGKPMGKGLAVLPMDVDGDGWMDAFVANDTVQKFFFHNNGDGTFTEMAASMGLGFDRNGNATGAMGVDAGHYRNDDAIGFVVGNFANEMSSLYVSQRSAWQFSDEAIGEGIGSPTRLRLKFGTFFFDYDLDGRLDLLHANGHLEEQINLVQPSQTYKQAAQLFWNAGPDAKACFADVPAETLGDLPNPIVGRGAAYADIDGDGDLDVLLTQIAGPPLLLRNDQALDHHWLRVKLVGKKCNRDAIGAWVELTAGGVRQVRQVMPTRSYLSQIELPITFGLGKVDRIDSLTVTWPGGAKQAVQTTGVDRNLVVEQSP